MKITKFIISSAFLLLAAFCCTNTNESQQAAVKEPYIKADSAFASQSLAFAYEHQWVSFNLSVLRMEESEMLQSGPMYDVVIKYDGEDSFVFFSDNNRHSLVTKDHPQIDGFDWDCLQMAWFYFHPIPFIDTKPYLKMLTSCKMDRDGDTEFFRYESNWFMGKADFMMKTDDFTLCRAGNRTYFWNDLYRFHNISFENKQPYIDSILMANS